MEPQRGKTAFSFDDAVSAIYELANLQRGEENVNSFLEKLVNETVGVVSEAGVNFLNQNQCLACTGESERANVIKTLLCKLLLPQETLSDLELAPPPGCPEKGWICVAFPCRSFKMLQNLPYRAVKKVRTWLGHPEEETEDYLKFLQKALKAKWVTGEEPYTALTLFPLKDLPKR
jgi:hypothetical protein